MDEEKKIIIAFLFKRSGKKEVKASDLYLTLSLELAWFSSQHAKQFIEQAIQQNFLEKKNDLLTPTFDISTVEIPVGFRPKKHQQTPASTEKQNTAANKKETDVTSSLITHICHHIGKPKEEIQTKIQELQNQKQITREVAAVLFAYTHHISTKEFYKEVEQSMLPGKHEEAT